MRFFSALGRWITALLGGLLLAGCNLSDGRGQNDQKNPHYLTGTSRLQSRDYRGAAEAFEKALESNPQSAAAHLELGLLHANQLNEGVADGSERDHNLATAIYHLGHHLRLSPKTPLASTIEQQVDACKIELAKTVSYMLTSNVVQKQIERLYLTNTTLRAQVEQLTLQLAQQAYAYSNKIAALQTQHLAAVHLANVEVEKARNERIAAERAALERAAASGRSAPPSASAVNPTGNPSRSSPPSTPVVPRSAATGSRSAAPPGSTARGSSGSSRSYVVRKGDTPRSIASRHGISVSALMAANPGVDDRRIKVGQTLNLPGARSQ